MRNNGNYNGINYNGMNNNLGLDLLNADGLDDCIKQNYSNAIGFMGGMLNVIPLELKDFFYGLSPELQNVYMGMSPFDRVNKLREARDAAAKAIADKAAADAKAAADKATADKAAADKAAADAKAIADKAALGVAYIDPRIKNPSSGGVVMPRKIHNDDKLGGLPKKETESLEVGKADSKKDESDEEEVDNKKSSKSKSSKKESGEEPKKFLGMPKAIGITVVVGVPVLIGLGIFLYLKFKK